MTRQAADESSVKWLVMAELARAAAVAAEAAAEAEVASKVRDEAIRRAKKAGATLSEVAALTGLSKALVQQITPGPKDVDSDDEDALEPVAEVG